MKIAIEFYGHLRTFRESSDNIKKNFIAELDNPDIFIHSWDNSDHSDISWHNKDGSERGGSVSEDDLDFIHKNFNPKALLLEPQMNPPKNDKNLMIITGNKVDFKNTFNVFYTKWKVNELRKEYQSKTGTQYDLVIQARLDLKFNKSFKIKEYITYKNLKGETIDVDINNKLFYCPEQYTFNQNQDLINSSGSDVLYFGKPTVLDKVVGLWDKLDEVNFKEDFYSNEYLLLLSALNNKIEPIKINFFKDKDFVILRPNDHKNKKSINDQNLVKKIITIFKN